MKMGLLRSGRYSSTNFFFKETTNRNLSQRLLRVWTIIVFFSSVSQSSWTLNSDYFIPKTNIKTISSSSYNQQLPGFDGANKIFLSKETRIRVPRSPFVPPSVMSFKKPIRKAMNSTVRLDKIPRPRVSLASPLVRAQEKDRGNQSSKNIGPIRNSSFNPPMVIHMKPPHKKPKVKKITTHEFPFQLAQELPLNDQDYKFPRSEKKGKENSKEVKLIDLDKYPSINKEQLVEHTFSGDPLILQKLFRLVKNGTSIADILNFTQSSELFSEVKNESTLANNSPVHQDIFGPSTKSVVKEKSRKKILAELPFTAIVHNVTVQHKGKLKKSFDTKESQKRGSEFNFYSDLIPQPKLKYGNDKSSYDERRYRGNGKYPKILSKNAYEIRFNSFKHLPIKNNPMVASLKPLQRKIPKKTDSTLLSTSDRTKEKSKKISSLKEVNLDGSSERNKKSKEEILYPRHQSNLRLVFPMRGILTFCAILGGLSVVTIVILIIYGAVKCNRNPNKSCYRLTDSQEIASLSGSSIKSASERII